MSQAYTWKDINLRSGYNYWSAKDAVFISHKTAGYMYHKDNSWWGNMILNAVPVNHAKDCYWINSVSIGALHDSFITGSVGMFKL